MANAFKLTDQVATNALLLLLKNELVFGKSCSKRYTEQFGRKQMQIGDTFTIRRHPEFIVSDGATFVNQDVVTGSAQVVIDKQKHIGITWQPTDQPLKVDNLLDNALLKAKMAQLAQQIESDIADKVLEFPNWVGDAGQLVNSAADFFKAPERLDLESIPQSDRVGILTPQDHWALAGSFTTATYFGNRPNDNALERGRLPMIGSIQPYMAQTVVSVTTGTRVAADGRINGANQNVNYSSVKDSYQQTLNIDGLAAGATIKRGEVFTIADVYAVNPRTKVSNGYLRQFVVLEDATADGGGAVALTIANPIIIPSGSNETLRVNTAFQTVNAAPADNAVVTFKGSPSTAYNMSSAFHRDAIQLCFVAPTRPNTGEYSYATDPETGISIRVWSFSDGSADTHQNRVDVLYGITNYDRRLGTKLTGTS